MNLDLSHYNRCILTLEKAYSLLLKTNNEEIDYDMYRSACIKEFEIILELSGKLLRKVLKKYFANAKEVDSLYFKDVFRQAVLRNFIPIEACERWFSYRDNRNNTAHDYGIGFANETLKLLPLFISDARKLSAILTSHQSED